jgi:hypothetical protein
MTAYRLAARMPDANSTESRLGAIGSGLSTPEDAEWVRGLCERVDPRGQRDAAIRAAGAILRQTSISGTAKEIEKDVRAYLANEWERTDYDRAEARIGAHPAWSVLRRHRFCIAKLTKGHGLDWRQILRIIEM